MTTASLTISTNPAVMRLAHPIRWQAAVPDVLSKLQLFFGPAEWGRLISAFQQEGVLTNVLTYDLLQQPENTALRTMVYGTAQMHGGTDFGNAYAMLFGLRQAVSPQPYFVIDDALLELLEHTDLTGDIPINMLNLPYPRCFIEFGTQRRCTVRLPNIDTGDHILEGAYCERGRHPDLGEILTVFLTGSPIGKTDAMDDASFLLYLPLSDPEKPISEALTQAYQEIAENRRPGLRPTPERFLAPVLHALQLLTKALLYIGLPEARRAAHPEKTAWLKNTAALKSAAKKIKAERKARTLVDHIVITAAPMTSTTHSRNTETTRPISTHWRRGFYRMQPYGPKAQLRRLTFVRPTLVHGGDVASEPPIYQVQ